MYRRMLISDQGELEEQVLGMFYSLLVCLLNCFCHCICVVHTDICSFYLIIAEVIHSLKGFKTLKCCC